jgi:hypothetical protein
MISVVYAHFEQWAADSMRLEPDDMRIVHMVAYLKATGELPSHLGLGDDMIREANSSEPLRPSRIVYARMTLSPPQSTSKSMEGLYQLAG